MKLKSFFLLLCTSAVLLSCTKMSQKDLGGFLSKIAIEDISTFVADETTFSLEEVLLMGENFQYLRLNPTNKSESWLTPVEVKYGLETAINKDFQAGRQIQGEMQSNTFTFSLTLNADGKCDPSALSDMYTEVAALIEDFNSLGQDFYILDVELLSTNAVLVDVITGTFYIPEDLGFGFNLFPQGESYMVFSSEFVNEVNDRLIFEYIDPNEFFLTDIIPNPSLDPYGLNVSASQIIGVLDDGCFEYAGTQMIWGGPELVFGGCSENTTLSGSEANEYINKGIDYICDPIPTELGFQLIKLEFLVINNFNTQNCNDCLPGSSCNESYPCFKFSHAWKEGRTARKAVYEK